jgi:hypothetical protein
VSAVKARIACGESANAFLVAELKRGLEEGQRSFKMNQ